MLGCWYESVTSGSEGSGQDTEGDEESSGTAMHNNTSEEGRTSESESENGQAGGLRLQECDCKEETTGGRRPEFNTQQSVVITKIGCTIWAPDGTPSKVHLSALEIGNLVFERSKGIPDSIGYAMTS